MSVRKHKIDFCKFRKIIKEDVNINIKLLNDKDIRFKKDAQHVFNRIIKKLDIDINLKKINGIESKFYSDLVRGVLKDGFINRGSLEEIISRTLSPILQKQQERLIKKSLGRCINPENIIVIGGLPGSKFYNSPEWRSIRYSILEKYGNTCQACGISPKQGAIIHVDHIKPRSIYPELALCEDNLQILCESCNIGKSNRFQKDWR